MPEDRWAKVKEFIAEWFEPLGEGDGYSEEEIAAAEASLGARFPEALREWYGFAGKWFLRIQVQDEQLLLSELKWENDSLIFHAENQWVFAWAIQKEDFDKDDPPIYNVADNKEFYGDKLSDFMLCAIFKERRFLRYSLHETVIHGHASQNALCLMEKHLDKWKTNSGMDFCYANQESFTVATTPWIDSGSNNDKWFHLNSKTKAIQQKYEELLGDTIRYKSQLFTRSQSGA
jgi:hypothetical protein